MITEWADGSEHNERPFDDSYPGRWAAFRACDGTYTDTLFSRNYIWARRRRRLVGYLVYTVWPRSEGWTDWTSCHALLTGLLGATRRPRLVIMDDVESWERKDLQRDHSRDLEAKRKSEVAYLNSRRPSWQRRGLLAAWYRSRDERRVIGYGNRSDLLTMAPGVKWRAIILADYSSAPTPARVGPWPVLARQYTDRGRMAPFARVDLNRAGMGPVALGRRLGLGTLHWRLR